MQGAGVAALLALWSATEPPSDVLYASLRSKAATLSESAGRYDEAELEFREAALAYERAGPAYDAERARTFTSLGSLAMGRGRFEESRQWLDRSRLIQERLSNRGLGHTLLALANLELMRRDVESAGRWLERSRLAMDRLGLEQGDESSWHVTRCWQLTLSASNDNARQACEQAHEKVIAEAGPEHLRMAVLELYRAQLQKQTGELEEAAESYREAATIFGSVKGPRSVPYARALVGLAHVRRMQQQFPSAASLAQRALGVFSGASDSSPLDRQAALQLVADLDRLQGNQAAAEQSVRQAIRLAEQAAGPDSPAVSDSLNTLAVILYQRPETIDEAGQLLERCLAIRRAHYGPLHLYLAEPSSNLAFVRIAQRRFAEAARLFERSLALRQEAVGTDHVSLAPILLGYAQALESSGDKRQARWARTKAARLAQSPRNPSRHVVSFADISRQ